jgi:hypothetical protein
MCRGTECSKESSTRWFSKKTEEFLGLEWDKHRKVWKWDGEDLKGYKGPAGGEGGGKGGKTG